MSDREAEAVVDGLAGVIASNECRCGRVAKFFEGDHLHDYTCTCGRVWRCRLSIPANGRSWRWVDYGQQSRGLANYPTAPPK